MFLINLKNVNEISIFLNFHFKVLYFFYYFLLEGIFNLLFTFCQVFWFSFFKYENRGQKVFK